MRSPSSLPIPRRRATRLPRTAMILAARILTALALATLVPGCQPSTSPESTDTAQVPSGLPADPVKAVQESMSRFLAARSFHAQLQLDGPQPLTAQMDYVAPDRYRITLPTGTQVIIGNTLYLQHEGQTQQVQVPEGQLAQWRDPLRLAVGEAPPSVEALGRDTQQGESLFKYRVRHANSDEQGMLYWMDANGLPRRIEQQGQTHGQAFKVILSYARYDDPAIRIDLPQ